MTSRKILSLSLLILTISIRQVSGEKETDKKCDPDDQYKCGDVCVKKTSSCHCGNVTLSKYSPSYCCTQPGDSCTRVGYRDATCSRGTPVPRSETCNDKCPEDSPSNTTIAEGKIVCDHNIECPDDDYFWNQKPIRPDSSKRPGLSVQHDGFSPLVRIQKMVLDRWTGGWKWIGPLELF